MSHDLLTRADSQLRVLWRPLARAESVEDEARQAGLKCVAGDASDGATRSGVGSTS